MKNLYSTYKSLVSKGDLLFDEYQEKAVIALDQLSAEIKSKNLKCVRKKDVYQWVSCLNENVEKHNLKGLYLYGSVGRGKSMLMDLFVTFLPVDKKRRVHFHSFMEEIHNRMHHVNPVKGQDPLLKMASDIAEEAAVLCFDEFYITNIADAMMLGRLFHMLFNLGVIVCATSNWKPEYLFKDGFNRMRYKPFIKEIEQNMHVFSLGESIDYRREKETSFPLMHFGDTAKNKKWLKDYFNTYAKTITQQHDIFLGVHHLKAEGVSDRLLWVTFDTLCKTPLSAEHYLKIAEDYDHILLEDVQVSFDNCDSDSLYRFVILIDVLYEYKKRFICTCEKPLTQLNVSHDLAFTFERTLSRLQEMQHF